MIGKWKYKAFFSDYWVYNGDIIDSYYIFNENNTFEYKIDKGYEITKGTYQITPVLGNAHTSIHLTFENGTKDYIMLIDLKDSVVEIQNKNFKEKYEKQQ